MDLPRPLRKLILQHNNISHIPSFTFRHLRPGLQSLHLSHNALGNDGMARVSFVGTYRSLGELLLDNNRLGEVPRCVRQFKNLQVLRLDNNQIRYNCIQFIMQGKAKCFLCLLPNPALIPLALLVQLPLEMTLRSLAKKQRISWHIQRLMKIHLFKPTFQQQSSSA